MPFLQESLLSQSEYRVGDPIWVAFRMTNSGDEDAYVLTWYTPLEGLWSDCLSVTRDGIKVPYEGPMAKRGAPSASAYVLIKAGQTVTREFDITEAYPIYEPGNYSVLLKGDIRDVISAKDEKEFDYFLNDSNRNQVRQSLDGRTDFVVVPGSKPRLTKAEKVRQQEQQRKLEAGLLEKQRFALTGPQDPIFVGGTATQQAQTKTAHQTGYQWCLDSIARLKDDVDYNEWFGAYTAARLAEVKDVYSKVKNKMVSDVFIYDLTCDQDIWGYTYPDTTTVWLCKKFWTAPNTGQDSKPGTIVHEHSHASAGTEDIEYGPDACRILAATDPDQAIKNADNFEYYSEQL